MCVSFGTTFNHDSPRQEDSSVARKITSSVGKIRLGQQESFELGNLDSRHGWGHAKEYVEGMWRILQHNEPGDFVLATGRADSVRHFCELAFAHIGQTIVWEGEGVNEVGRDEATGAVRVSVSPDDYHPAEVGPRYEDVMGAKTALGWEAKISLNELGKEMVASDIELMNPNLAECEA